MVQASILSKIFQNLNWSGEVVLHTSALSPIDYIIDVN